MAERMHRTLINIVRTMLIQANLPSIFWVKALISAVYVLNRVPHAVVAFNIPFQLLFCRQPYVQAFRVFGCLCYAHIAHPIPHKLAPRSRRCIFIGYAINM